MMNIKISGFMNKKINTFIFDCFGVICSSTLSAWYKDNMLKRGLEDKNLLDVFNEFDLGKLSEDDIANYFSKYEGINSTKEKIQEEIDGYLKLDERLASVILELKSQGLKVALLSNANSTFFDRMVYPKYPQFKGLFDEIVISSEVGMTKPGKDIYLHALGKINSKPEESLFIDDSQINVDSAIKLGINGFLYTNVESFLDYTKTLGF